MSRAPQLRRLSERDFAAELRSLVSALNPFLTDVGNALARGLSFDNIQGAAYEVTLTMPERWIAPTLLNSWENLDTASYNAAGYWKDPSGVVRLRGFIGGGTYGLNLPVFVLPEAYCPARREVLAAAQASIFEPAGRVDVFPNGRVVADDVTSIQSGASTYLSLDGLSFQASDPTPVAPGAPFPITLGAWDLPVKPQSLFVVRCRDSKGNGAPYPNPSWNVVLSGASPAVSVTDLVGLAPGEQYTVRFAVLGF